MMKGLLLSFVCLVAIYCSCINAIRLDEALSAQFPAYWTNLQARDQNANATIMQATPANQVTVFAFSEKVIAANYSYLIVEGSHTFLYEPLALRTLLNMTTPSANNTNNHQALAFTSVGTGLFVNDYISNEGSQVLKQIQCDNGVIIVIDQSTNHLSPPSIGIQDTLSKTTAQNFTFNTLKQLLSIAGVEPYVNFENSKTVFAPHDEVFTALFNSNPILYPYFTNGRNQSHTLSNIKLILGAHIIPSPVFATDATVPTEFQNEAGTSLLLTPPQNWNVSNSFLTVTENSTTTGVNTARVLQANILTNGGVIHVVDTVFIPSNFELPLTEVLDTLNASQFQAVIKAKGLIPYIADISNYTVFVPVDSAFNGADPSVENMLYHFVTAPVADVAFNNTVLITAANSTVADVGKQKLFLTAVGDVLYVNGIRVLNNVPYKSSQGSQVYLIGSLIPFPTLLKDSLTANSTFRSLLGDEHINTNSKLFNLNQANTTVFAPTDAAFDALLPGIVGYWSLNKSEAIQSVVDVLNNHIIPSNNSAVYTFPEGISEYLSANNEVLEVVKTMNNTRVNTNARVTQGPIITSGGTGFVVDQVLLPENYSLTARQTLEGFSGYDKSANPWGTYEKFLALMRNVDLDYYINTVAPDSYITIFAPNDEAFSNTDDTDNYENNTDIIRAILLNHVSLTNVGLGLNVTGMTIPVGGNNSGVPDYIKVTQDGAKPEIELIKAGVSSGTANVILETRGEASKAVIYGINRVLGVAQRSGGSSHSGLKTWQIIAIAVGGGLLGLLLLAVLIAAVYYLVLRPKSGYRKIN